MNVHAKNLLSIKVQACTFGMYPTMMISIPYSLLQNLERFTSALRATWTAGESCGALKGDGGGSGRTTSSSAVYGVVTRIACRWAGIVGGQCQSREIWPRRSDCLNAEDLRCGGGDEGGEDCDRALHDDGSG